MAKRIKNLRVRGSLDATGATLTGMEGVFPPTVGRAPGDVLTIVSLGPPAVFGWTTPATGGGGDGGGTPALIAGTWSSSFPGYSGFELAKISDGSLTTSFISQCPDASEDAAVLTFAAPKRITSFKVSPHNGSEARSAGLKMQAATSAAPGTWVTLATFGPSPVAGYTEFPVSDATVYAQARLLNQTGGGSSPLSIWDAQVYGY